MSTSVLDSKKTLCHVVLAVDGLTPHFIAKTQSYIQGSCAQEAISGMVRVVAAQDNSSRLELALDDGLINKIQEFIYKSGRDRAMDFSIHWVQPFRSRASTAFVHTGLRQKIRIEEVAQRLFCGDKEVLLSPQLFAWYVWMVKRCLNAPLEHRSVRWTDVGIAEEFLKEYGKVVGTMTHYYEKAACLLADGMTQEFFQEKKARVNRRLKDTLQGASEPYLIKASGRRPTQKFGVIIKAGSIEIA